MRTHCGAALPNHTRQAAGLITSLCSWLNPTGSRPILASLITGAGLVTLLVVPAATEVRTVEARGEYRMGDRDTREDALRLATEAAKKNALEQVATYLESVTVVSDLDVTKDEIRTYTAGMVLVLNKVVHTSLEGDSMVIRVDLTAQVDPDEAAQAISALRENEDARRELVTLREEVDQLHQQLEEATQALASAPTPEAVKVASQQRQEVLNQIQANGLVSQAWNDWILVTPVASPYPWTGLQQVQGLVVQARRLNPTNRHVRIVQQVITAQAPASAPRPSPPSATAGQGAPASSPPSIGAPPPSLHQVVPPRGAKPPSPGPPLDTTDRIPSGQLGQLPPPSAVGDVPRPRSSSPLAQSSTRRHLSPTLHQVYPPPPHQIQHAPFRVPHRAPGMAPRGFSGGHGRR